MRKWLYTFVILVISGVLTLTACKKESVEEEDEIAIRELVPTLSYFSLDDAYLEGGFISDTLRPGEAKGDTFVIGWWRKPLSISRDIYVNFASDSAFVQVKTHIYGKFHVVYVSFSGDTVDTFSVDKPLHDVVTRYGLFVREGGLDEPHRGWVLKAVSFGFCESKYVPDTLMRFTIDSLKIGYYNDSVQQVRTYSDFAILIPIEDLPTIGQGGQVKFELWTSPTFPGVMAWLYRSRKWGVPVRVRMIPEGGYFTYTMPVPSDTASGINRFGISVIPAFSFRPSQEYPYVTKGILFPLISR